jgi:type III pantothenate kinase
MCFLEQRDFHGCKKEKLTGVGRWMLFAVRSCILKIGILIMKCLVVDIGNTSTSLAIAENHTIVTQARIKKSDSTYAAIKDLLLELKGDAVLDGSIVASVVPDLNDRWGRALKCVLGNETIFVSHKINLGIEIDYPNPETIGADRLVNAVAASSLYGCPAIVADFGTALTFDILSSANKYVGGIITPGLPLMTDYLHEKTALLPHVDLEGDVPPIGKSTEDAIKIGATVGYRGILRETVTHLKTVLGVETINLAATGGYASWVLEGLDMPFVLEPNLTLIGLSYIFKLNM